MTRIAIVGPGAVASIIAWHLSDADCALTLVARQATASAIEREGLTLLGGGADVRARHVKATADPTAAGVQDIVLVGFKAQDWLAGWNLVRPLVGPDTILVPMLNGVPWWYFQGIGGAHEGRIVRAVDPDGALTRDVPSRQILGCVIYVGAERESAARIKWNGRKRLVIGEPLDASSERLASLVAVLRDAGVDAEASGDIRRDVWVKLLGNVTYNPLSVVAGATMGRMHKHAPLREIVRIMMTEAAGVANALGVAGEFDIEDRLQMRPEMYPVRTSMLQDYEAGRTLELGGIVNAVSELGRLVGRRTPTIDAIGALAAERELRRGAIE